MLVKSVTWLFWTYLTLKVIHLAFGRDPGVRDAPWTVRRRLLRGEPWLFAIAFLISVPAAVISVRYFHHAHQRGFAHAVGCYGRLRNLNALPHVRGRFDAFKVYDVIVSDEWAANEGGRWLGVDRGRIDHALTQQMRSYAERYSAVARRGPAAEAAEIPAIEECLKYPGLYLDA
jgi:hypothetical protein